MPRDIGEGDQFELAQRIMNFLVEDRKIHGPSGPATVCAALTIVHSEIICEMFKLSKVEGLEKIIEHVQGAVDNYHEQNPGH